MFMNGKQNVKEGEFVNVELSERCSLDNRGTITLELHRNVSLKIVTIIRTRADAQSVLFLLIDHKGVYSAVSLFLEVPILVSTLWGKN